MDILSFFDVNYLPRCNFARRRLQPSTSGGADEATDDLRFWDLGSRWRIQFRIRWSHSKRRGAIGRGGATVLVGGDSEGQKCWTSQAKSSRGPQEASQALWPRSLSIQDIKRPSSDFWIELATIPWRTKPKSTDEGGDTSWNGARCKTSKTGYKMSAERDPRLPTSKHSTHGSMRTVRPRNKTLRVTKDDQVPCRDKAGDELFTTKSWSHRPKKSPMRHKKRSRNR